MYNKIIGANLEKLADPGLNQIFLLIMELLVDRSPVFVGFGGHSGVGKTTLVEDLSEIYKSFGYSVLVLRIDDFKKSKAERSLMPTEWDENHMDFQKMEKVFQQIKQNVGVIQIPRFDQFTYETYLEEINTKKINLFIIEGLYGISRETRLANPASLLDLKFFLEGDIAEIKQRRYQQELKKDKPRSPEEFEKHWQQGIELDYLRNIQNSRATADYIVTVKNNFKYKVSEN